MIDKKVLVNIEIAEDQKKVEKNKKIQRKKNQFVFSERKRMFLFLGFDKFLLYITLFYLFLMNEIIFIDKI